MPGRPSIKIEIGRRFGLLTVLQREGRYHGGIGYKCKCICGIEKIVGGSFLKRGLIVSCGVCRQREISAQRRRFDGGGLAHIRYKSSQKWARQKNIRFSLSFQHFRLLEQQPCFYCGAPPSLLQQRFAEHFCNGIDRVNNNLGYTLKNAVPCCWICNSAKTNLSVQQFLTQIKRIYGCAIRPSR